MWRIFSDSNDINEQSVAAFVAIALIVIIVLAVVISGLIGRQLVIEEFIFVSLLTFAASSLGIAGWKSINGKNS